MKVITIETAIGQLAEYLRTNNMTCTTKDPTCRGLHEDVIAVDISSKTGGMSVGSRGSFEQSNASSDFGDKYIVYEKYNNRDVEVTRGSFLDLSYDFRLLANDVSVEESELEYGSDWKPRSDAITPIYKRM